MVLSQRSYFEKGIENDQPNFNDKPVQDNGLFVSITKTHLVSTFIHHWQLRDLICLEDNYTIIHPRQHAIYKYDIRTGEDLKCQVELPFTPTTLDTRDGYLVAGGQTGMLMVKNLITGHYRIYRLGGGMNNSVRLWPRNNKKLCVTVCNNDQSVYISTIPGVEKIQTLNMPSAINHCSISPDGKKLLMVSDQGRAYLYYINKNGFYKEYTRYRVSEERSLSCAWNQSSDIFAVASQDGFVSVFNIYSSSKLAQFGSSETRKTKKAARCIQFSSGPIDLLAYSEHVSNIYIVDTRTFETRQIIRLSPENEDHPITGLTFSPNAKSLYVALQDRLIELQVDTCQRRQFGGGRLI